MLVGVPSFRSEVALKRREAIRELMAVGAPPAAADSRASVTVRFVMADDQRDSDAARGDCWFFPLPASRRAKQSYGLEKYLLSNHFLRYAVTRNDTPPLLVLSDDDTVFNATSLTQQMAPFSSTPRLVFGNVEEWFMWDPIAMISTCFAYSSRRWELARQASSNVSFASLSRREKECVHAHAVGPFPYAKGHFLGYSLPTARELVRLFDCCGDEAYAVGERNTRHIQHPFYNQLLPPTHPSHPANKVLTEDVYYMHLLFKELRHAPLTILHLTLSEYVVERGNRALHYATVYHKLKRPDRFEYIRKRPHLLLPGLSGRPRRSADAFHDGRPPAPMAAAPPHCQPMTAKYRVRRRGKLVAKLEHCCEQWTWCELPQASPSSKRVNFHL